MIAVDPTSDALWVTNLLGSEVDRVDLGTYQITPYQLKEGSKPWQITVDANYVYAIDYGARNLVRIDKNEVMGPIDYVPLPRTSDSEQAYGLAMSADGTTLYFTLSDDGAPSSLGGTTFGYVNVAAWEAASALCPSGTDCAPAPADAVVYTGLDGAIDPNGKGDFRGIAVNGAGDVAIADADPGSANGVIRLTP
jgi:DNA-binding beta-propeller fold protein YncE